MENDTIVAISTPPGRSGVGVVRVSGPATGRIVRKVTGGLPEPREARLRDFRNTEGEIIDRGLLLHFPAPGSFTGEHVAEFQAHGSMVVLQLLFETICACGARAARPGEFTERAFRHGKIDLAQAEAIADLIESRSARAARSALRTMQGAFSRQTRALIDRLHMTRAQLEASIDFPEDTSPGEIAGPQLAELTSIRAALRDLTSAGRQGARLNSGGAVVIAGAPNVGKSTLMNALAGEDKAIVSDVPGTTRDVIECDTLMNDIPIRMYDTAGLRESLDSIERDGIERATRAMRNADIVLVMTEAMETRPVASLLDLKSLSEIGDKTVIIVHNKIDVAGVAARVEEMADTVHVFLSARVPDGLDGLVRALAGKLCSEQLEENEFIARERHLAALGAAAGELVRVDREMLMASPEIAAECLQRAVRHLSEISGEYSTEDMLGEIFSRFCIGK